MYKTHIFMTRKISVKLGNRYGELVVVFRTITIMLGMGVTFKSTCTRRCVHNRQLTKPPCYTALTLCG